MFAFGGNCRMKSIRRLVSVLFALFLLTSSVSCSSSKQSSKTEADATTAILRPSETLLATTPASPTTQAIQQSVQKTFDELAQMYSNRDVSMVNQLVDPSASHVKTLMRARANLLFAQHSEPIVRRFQVESVQLRQPDLLQARFTLVDTSVNKVAQGRWPLRLVDGRWLITEPRPEELKPITTTTIDRFILITDGWSTEQIPVFRTMLAEAVTRVQQHIPELTAPSIRLVVASSSKDLEVVRLDSVGRYFAPTNNGPEQLVVMNPETYMFGALPSDWEDAVTGVIAHEYTHYITSHQLGFSLSRASPWMYEGIAEYIAYDGNTTITELAKQQITDIIARNKLVPLVAESSNSQQDLQHFAPQDDPNIAYILSESAVRYCVENHGGISRFWDLMRAYNKYQNLNMAVQQVYNISAKDLDRQWEAWLKETYSPK